MSLQSIVQMCLCCQVFLPSNKDTIFRYPGRDGQHQLRVSGYHLYEHTCSVHMKREKYVEVLCPKKRFPVSKPLLTSSPSSSSTYTMLECLDRPSSSDIVSRRHIKLFKPLTLGRSSVSLIATSTQNDSITIHLQSPKKDSHLFYVIGFFFIKWTNVVRRGVLIRGLRPELETDTPYFPYVINREFNTTIVALEEEFKIYVDNVDMFTYKYRQPKPQIVAMRVVGMIEYREIIIT